MSATTPLRQPGLFIAQRPLLAILLVLSALGLLGFAGGALVSENIRTGLLERLGEFVWLAVFVAFFCLLPLLAPADRWARVLVAAGVFAAGSLLAFFGTTSQEVEVDTIALSLTSILLISLCASSLILVQPMTGRIFPLAAIVSPFLGLVGLVSTTGYLIRHNVTETEFVLVAQSLGFTLALLAGTYFSASLSRYSMIKSIGGRLVAGLTFNRLLRDIVFWSLAAVLFFTFFTRDPLALETGLSSPWIGLFVVVLFAVPVLVITAGATSIWAPTRTFARSRALADKNASALSAVLLRVFTPASLRAILVVFLIVATVLFVETPFAAFTETGEGINLTVSVLLRFSFYGIIFALTAITYMSFRMATLVAVVLLVTDILTAGTLTVLAPAQGAAVQLIDVVPRLLALMLIVRIARNWADILHNRFIGKRQISLTYVTAVAPAVVGILLCILAFCGIGLLNPTLAAETEYMALRLTIQSGLTLLMLPAAMSVFVRWKFSL